MGLFGSLFTGVSALFAQSQNTAIISNNIANINTTGFKRSEASFQSLVTTESRSSRYSPGTVSVNRLQRVDQQGSIQQTASATDASVSGNGFFPVKRSTDFGQEFLYTRAGQFSEDSQGILRNASGFILYAWPIDSEGNLPANQGDLTSLVVADVAFLRGLTRPTNTADLAINLDADQVDIDPHSLATPQTLSVETEAANFSRGLTVYDTLGSAQTVTLEFRKIVGPMAHATTGSGVVLQADDVIAGGGLATGVLTGINHQDVLSITLGATTETFEFFDSTISAATGTRTHDIQTVQEYVTAINSFGTGNQLRASLKSSGQVLIQAIDPTVSFTVSDVTGTPVSGATALSYVTDPDGDNVAPDYTYSPEFNIVTNTDNTVAGTADYTQSDFPTFANTGTPNTQGWWEMTIIHPDGTIISQGLLNFDGDGTLNASADADGNIDIELSNVDWGNGSNPQDFTLDIERFSQFSGNYDVIFSDQDGAELGLRTGVEITREGVVVARFSNGASADLYQIPLITFSNSNGLTEVSGTAYTENEESGEENLREAGSGGAGFIEPSTLESSNVDLADEFAKLIVAQRAFGAGTKVITTVDQMTEDLLRLR